MTKRQRRLLTSLLTSLKNEIILFHHGDCVGADEQAHYIALDLGIEVAIHPPSTVAKRAFCTGWKKRYLPKPYMERNIDIVNCTELLIGCPKENDEEIRSGTWSTMRYAWRHTKPVRVLDPYAH